MIGAEAAFFTVKNSPSVANIFEGQRHGKHF